MEAVPLLNLNDHRDLDRAVEGQRSGPDGHTSMASGVAEDLDEQIGAAIDDGRLLSEIGGTVDESLDAHDARDAIKGAEFLAQSREQSQTRLPRGFLGLRNTYADAYFARHELAGSVARDVTSEEKQITGTHDGHVVGHGRSRGRQRDL